MRPFLEDICCCLTDAAVRSLRPPRVPRSLPLAQRLHPAPGGLCPRRTGEADHPYSVSERNYTIERLQPGAGPTGTPCSSAMPRETIDFSLRAQVDTTSTDSEGSPTRGVSHGMLLAMDYSATTSNPRRRLGGRHDDPDLLLTAMPTALHRQPNWSLQRERLHEPDSRARMNRTRSGGGARLRAH